jgi:acetyltransferase
VGGVALNLDDDAALSAALVAMAARVGQARPDARIAGFAVQAMVRRPGAIELIVGIHSDPLFGPVVLFGQGGVAVEVMADQTVGLPPLNRVLAADMISRTRVARLLAGYRNQPAADLEAIADVLIRVGQLAADLAEVAELDINPLLADASGVIALDARMRLVPVNAADAAGRMAILPYPDQLEQRVDSAVGPLLIRPIRPEDAPAHVAFFQALSAEDIHLRMFGAMRALTPAQLARFTQIDYAREMAFIASRPLIDGALAGAETLAVARVAIDPDGVAGEFAIVVRSDLKGRGLGSLMFDCLLGYCRERGLDLVTGVTLPENAPMQALARSRGFTLRRLADGTVAMSLRLRDAEGSS